MTEPAGLDLPALQDELLSWDTVDQLFQDLATAVEPQAILAVLIKDHARAHARQAAVDLSAARDALAQGMAVQIRYRHAGTSWCDSLIQGTRGVRIVRIAVP